MILICVPLLTGNVEHLLVRFLIICISSFETCPFKFFAEYLIFLVEF